MQIDPMTGVPTIVNQLGSLDVDIIMDEGPDQVNMMADAYDTLTVLAGQGAQIPPNVLVELSPLAGSVKKRINDMLAEKDPMQEEAKKIALASEAAKVKELESQAMMNIAKARSEMAKAQGELDTGKVQAEMTLKQQELMADISLEEKKLELERERAGDGRAQHGSEDAVRSEQRAQAERW
jgi:hypothetical protein